MKEDEGLFFWFKNELIVADDYLVHGSKMRVDLNCFCFNKYRNSFASPLPDKGFEFNIFKSIYEDDPNETRKVPNEFKTQLLLLGAL